MRSNVVGGKSFVTGDTTNDPYADGFGHGTHVSGIIGAKNNGQGIIGVAPGGCGCGDTGLEPGALCGTRRGLHANPQVLPVELFSAA